MKLKAIIITENNTEVYQMQGLLPKIFYFFYFWFYRLQIRIFTIVLGTRYKIQLVCARDLFPNCPFGIDKIYYYDDLFRSFDFKKERENILNFSKNWSNNKVFSKIKSEFYFKDVCLPDVSRTRFSILLAFSGVSIYKISLKEILRKEKPAKIICLSRSSKPEIIGQYIGRKMNIPYFAIPFNLTDVDFLVKKYLRFRERQMRKKEILEMSKGELWSMDRIKSVVLLVGSMPMYLKSAVPLLEKLSGNGLLLSSIVGTETLLAQLKAKVNWQYLFCYLSTGKIKKILSENERGFKKIYHDYLSSLGQGYSEEDLYYKLSKEELRRLFYSYFPLTCAYVLAFEAFLKNSKIKKAVIFSDRGIFENVVCQVCKKRGIETIHVSPNNVMSPDQSNEYNIADIVTVPGSYMRDELVGIGRDPQKIKVVGDLKLESTCFYQSEKQNKLIREKYSIDQNKKTVLLISWPIIAAVPLDEKKDFFLAVDRSVKKLPNAQLIIKPHPNESLGALQEQLKMWQMDSVRVIQNLNLLELLAISDVMVMIWSMAAFEAIAMRVPVIAVNFARKDYEKHIPYATEKGAIEVTNKNQLYSQLKRLLQDEQYHNQVVNNGLKFAEKYVGSLDGKASERIIKLLD